MRWAELLATPKTFRMLQQKGIPAVRAPAAEDAAAVNVMSLLQGGVDLVINLPTPTDPSVTRHDYLIRRTAVDFGIPLLTNPLAHLAFAAMGAQAGELSASRRSHSSTTARENRPTRLGRRTSSTSERGGEKKREGAGKFPAWPARDCAPTVRLTPAAPAASKRTRWDRSWTALRARKGGARPRRPRARIGGGAIS